MMLLEAEASEMTKGQLIFSFCHPEPGRPVLANKGEGSAFRPAVHVCTGVGGSYAQTGVPQAASSATYNVNNQLTNWQGATLTYDLNGNLTSDGSFSFWIFLLEGSDTWNARNQLVSISGPTPASFQYDAFGRRVSKTVNGTTQFLYDGVNPVQEISGGSASANLLTGGVDEYFQRTDSIAGARSFLTDALGSTLALTDSNGAVLTSYTYEPFGNTQVSSSTTNSFAYTGRELDSTGLYFYRARYYKPQIQRFASEDPIGIDGGDANLYGYTFQSPTNFIDPFGLSPGGDGSDTAGRKRGCPSPPPHPPGVSVDANIVQTEIMMSMPRVGPTDPGILQPAFAAGWWFYQICCSGSSWNYKRLDRSYDDFGNYNFGATGAALGIPENALLWFAGAKKYGQLFPHGTGDPKDSNPLGHYPWGNQRQKSDCIKAGIGYFKNSQ